MANKARQALGYYRAAHNYWHTPKGRHDILDYMRATGIILGIALLLSRAIQWLRNV